LNNMILEMKPGVEPLNTGVEGTKALAASVTACLADTYLLLVKTQACHWNVVGPLFHSVHLITEEQYNDLFRAVDEIAERIRALGYPAPSSFTDMVAVSGISEDGGNATTEEMIGNLVKDHEAATRRFREAVRRADDNKDVVTADMLTARMAFHEKSVWMLKALLTT
jgi:starvation-inducible DNA-binding protein